LILSCLLAGALPAVAAQKDTASPVLAGKVTRVIDGDTLDVLLDSGRIRVRLQGVDAPELRQPRGREAARWLQQRLRDQNVLLEPVSQDRYERMVAVVFLEDVNVNRELVRQGQAWAYRQYLRRKDRILCDLEAAARKQRLGLWALPAAQRAAPWEYRASHGRGPFTDYSGTGADDCRREIRHRSGS
jgi:endonuclease YncB( thermonuclease family)